MLSDFIDFVKDTIKEIFTFIWEILSEFVALIIKDFLFILLALLALGAFWYFGGGYDQAEKDYAAQQKKADESAQLEQQLQQQKAQNPDTGIYIIK